MTPIVLCETDTGKKIIDGEISAVLSSAPFYTLDLAARYVCHVLDEDDVRPYLDFVAKGLKAPGYIVDSVVNGDYAKRPIVDVRKVSVTDAELATIAKVDGGMKKKVLFTLLCLAKYYDKYRGTTSGWENRSVEEVSALANVSLNKERLCYLLCDLKESGLISFSNRVSSTSVHVEFIEDGNTAVDISDMRNLGWQYERLNGKRFSVCKKCGALFPYTDKHVFCRDCREEPKIEIENPWY